MRRNAVMPVEAVMSPPPGTERVNGDEFHDPENWQRCTCCGVDCPEDSDRCFYCGEPLP